MSIRNSRTALTALLTIGILGQALATAALAEEPSAKELESRGTGPVSDAEFEQLHQKLVRMSKEKVWSIPWQLSVRKARELAAEQKKPVFLWISSNGGTHPLGPC